MAKNLLILAFGVFLLSSCAGKKAETAETTQEIVVEEVTEVVDTTTISTDSVAMDSVVVEVETTVE